MPGYDVFMKVETVDGEPKADDRFAIDWANEVALGGPDTAPDDGGFVVESGADGAIAGIVIAATTDNNRLDTNWSDNFVVESGDTNIGVGELQECTISKSMDFGAEYDPFGFADSIDPLDAHTGGANFVFCDGSVRLVGTSDAIATSDFFLV